MNNKKYQELQRQNQLRIAKRLHAIANDIENDKNTPQFNENIRLMHSDAIEYNIDLDLIITPNTELYETFS